MDNKAQCKPKNRPVRASHSPETSASRDGFGSAKNCDWVHHFVLSHNRAITRQISTALQQEPAGVSEILETPGLAKDEPLTECDSTMAIQAEYRDILVAKKLNPFLLTTIILNKS
jgi:hypothetical protein